jgi:N-methylhydantoinase B
MEHDGRDDRIYTIRATVVKEGDSITFDYTGTDPQAPGVLNCAEVGSTGNVIAALGTVLAPDLPFNDGILDPVKIISPPGTLVNAVKPAPISAATVFGAWFGTDAILDALNYLISANPETAQRATGPWGSWTFAWMMGPNQHGEPWFWNVFTGGSGGAGALRDHDGEPAMMGIQTVDAFTPNIEDYEQQSPALFLERRLAPDSGGAGQRRGGQCLESFCIPWGTDGWDLVVFHNRVSAPSSAVSGGQPGAGSSIKIARGVGHDALEKMMHGDAPAVRDYIDLAEEMPTRGKDLRMGPDDGYYMRATGGPGYGDPVDRDPEDVANDVASLIVTTAMAEKAYGVILDADGDTDIAATHARRAEVRAERRGHPATRNVLVGGRDVADAGALGTGQTQVLGEYLHITPDGYYHCRDCNHRYCGSKTNWKWFAAFREDPITADVIQNDIRPRPSADLVFRRYFCPQCGIQADTEVALPDEAPRWNFQPLEVWRSTDVVGTSSVAGGT